MNRKLIIRLCRGTMIKKKKKRLQEMLDEIIDAKTDKTKD
jgi:hypothetical protein